MRVVEIWRYPVKSLGGEALATADVDALGITGDRAWGLYDPVADRVLTARREPRLLFLSARLVDGAPEIVTDEGESLTDDASLSAWLGRPVELRSAADGSAQFETPLDEDRETDWVAWESTAGTFHDGRSKVSIVARPSIGDWDHRRFRINLLTEDGDERTLAGELRIGSAGLTTRGAIERCIMVTRAQPGIERDLEVLKRVRRERNNEMGIGTVVTVAGTIAVGDEVLASN